MSRKRKKKALVKNLTEHEEKCIKYMMAQALLKAQVRKGLLAESCFVQISKRIDQILENDANV